MLLLRIDAQVSLLEYVREPLIVNQSIVGLFYLRYIRFNRNWNIVQSSRVTKVFPNRFFVTLSRVSWRHTGRITFETIVLHSKPSRLGLRPTRVTSLTRVPHRVQRSAARVALFRGFSPLESPPAVSFIGLRVVGEVVAPPRGLAVTLV